MFILKVYWDSLIKDFTLLGVIDQKVQCSNLLVKLFLLINLKHSSNKLCPIPNVYIGEVQTFTITLKE